MADNAKEDEGSAKMAGAARGNGTCSFCDGNDGNKCASRQGERSDLCRAGEVMKGNNKRDCKCIF